jgi:predicted dehydrogenase
MLRYPKLRVVLHADMLSPSPEPRFVAQGDQAGFVSWGLDPQEDRLKAGRRPGTGDWGVDPAPGRLTDGASGDSRTVQGEVGDWRRYYIGIAAAARGAGPNPVTPDEALAVMRLIEAGLESSRRGAEVRL